MNVIVNFPMVLSGNHKRWKLLGGRGGGRGVVSISIYIVFLVNTGMFYFTLKLKQYRRALPGLPQLH